MASPKSSLRLRKRSIFQRKENCILNSKTPETRDLSRQERSRPQNPIVSQWQTNVQLNRTERGPLNSYNTVQSEREHQPRPSDGATPTCSRRRPWRRGSCWAGSGQPGQSRSSAAPGHGLLSLPQCLQPSPAPPSPPHSSRLQHTITHIRATLTLHLPQRLQASPAPPSLPHSARLQHTVTRAIVSLETSHSGYLANRWSESDLLWIIVALVDFLWTKCQTK